MGCIDTGMVITAGGVFAHRYCASVIGGWEIRRQDLAFVGGFGDRGIVFVVAVFNVLLIQRRHRENDVITGFQEDDYIVYDRRFVCNSIYILV